MNNQHGGNNVNAALAQKIFSLVVLGVESEDWKNLKIEYKADDYQSEYYGTYETTTGTGYVRTRLLTSDEKRQFSESLRLLREQSKENGEAFTHCTITYQSDGKFSFAFNYDPIDWSITVD